MFTPLSGIVLSDANNSPKSKIPACDLVKRCSVLLLLYHTLSKVILECDLTGMRVLQAMRATPEIYRQSMDMPIVLPRRILINSTSSSEKFEWRCTWLRPSSFGFTTVLFLVGLTSLIAIPLGYLAITSLPKSTTKCDTPLIRREWRSLDTEERHNYIQAVQCLQDLPSELAGRGSLYDDLVYVHMQIGSKCPCFRQAANDFLRLI